VANLKADVATCSNVASRSRVTTTPNACAGPDTLSVARVRGHLADVGGGGDESTRFSFENLREQ
jgi:hypothetical protein